MILMTKKYKSGAQNAKLVNKIQLNQQNQDDMRQENWFKRIAFYPDKCQLDLLDDKTTMLRHNQDEAGKKNVRYTAALQLADFCVNVNPSFCRHAQELKVHALMGDDAI